MSEIATRLQALQQAIQLSLQRHQRTPDSVRLLAVSKGQPLAILQEALAVGLSAFGENYLQEALPKILALPKRIEWHYIGVLQTNKTRKVAEHFTWVHSVTSLSLAQRLNDQRPAELPPLQVCLQVNTSGELQKAGVTLRELPALAQACSALPRLRLRGFMTIPASEQDPAAQRLPYAKLHLALEECRALGLPLDTLSMGMSADFDAAIAEGATLIRIGTALFGPRTPPKYF